MILILAEAHAARLRPIPAIIIRIRTEARLNCVTIALFPP